MNFNYKWPRTNRLFFKQSENEPQPSPVHSTCRDTSTEEQNSQVCTEGITQIILLI